MHQTTVRFGADLWSALEAEAAALGVSVAQYVRESALTRLSYTRGLRGDADYDRALGGASGGAAEELEALRQSTDDGGLESRAVWAQARQARERAVQLRESSRRTAARRH